MQLIYFSVTLLCLFMEWAAAVETRNSDHHRLIERLDALEEQQRDSRSKIEELELTVKSQAKIIKSQSRDIEGLEFIVQKHRTRVQRTYRQSRLNKHNIIAMKKILMDAGMIENKKPNKTETKNHHAVVELNEVQHQELIEANNGTRHEGRHRVQTRILKRDSSTIGRLSSKRQERAGISFSVYLDHDMDFGAHQTIKFNQIITNEGNGYNSHSGVFTCPEAGMYLFSFFVGQRGESVPKGMVAELMVNSKNMLDAIVDSHSPGQDITGGNMAILRLNQGDVVWIDSLGKGGHAEGSTGLKLTSFSGSFLYQ